MVNVALVEYCLPTTRGWLTAVESHSGASQHLHRSRRISTTHYKFFPSTRFYLLCDKFLDWGKVCELCRSWTSFYCSGCRSHLCFQAGAKTITDNKIVQIRKTLKLSDDTPIPKYNKMTTYDPKTKKRTEMKVLNSCYHIVHSKKFTEYFSNMNLHQDGIGFFYGDNTKDDDENDNDEGNRNNDDESNDESRI